MTGRIPLVPLAAASLGATLLAGALTGCTPKEPAPPAGQFPAAPMLVAYDSCAQALAQVRRAAKESVTPYGFPNSSRFAMPAAGGRAMSADAAAPDHSGTTVQEAGVDEPDRVKTDGRRIVTVTGGVLHVVDAASRTRTGRLDLRADRNDPIAGVAPTILLSGDRALVLAGAPYRPTLRGPAPRRADQDAIAGPRLLLVDLSGAPTLIGRYRTDGEILGARQVGGVARVVVRATPRVVFPVPAADIKSRRDPQAELLAGNREAIDRAPIDAWQPRYEVTDAGGGTRAGRVPCDRLVRPASFSGGSLLTLLTFDLTRPLGDGDPLAVLADGDCVYATAASLYVAADNRWWATGTVPGRSGVPAARTELFTFDTAGAGRPRYVAGGAVDGHVLNQYALSEWQGHLRVATTTGDGGDRSESAVRVLRRAGGALVETGAVGGLGRGERIVGVRYAGATGYVVTFRRTDPLYVVDLRDPADPRLAGQLKITGYSAYLHPAGDDRLIGIGQEADNRGVTQGAQVSLFDVRDPAAPVRLARYQVPGASSEAEFDPHAFLYWPADGTIVLPVTGGTGPNGIIEGDQPFAAAALVLRLTGRTLARVGRVEHPVPRGGQFGGGIARALVIGDTLWTVSDTGALASARTTATTRTWVPWA